MHRVATETYGCFTQTPESSVHANLARAETPARIYRGLLPSVVVCDVGRHLSCPMLGRGARDVESATFRYGLALPRSGRAFGALPNGPVFGGPHTSEAAERVLLELEHSVIDVPEKVEDRRE